MHVKVNIWIASKTRWAHLTKMVAFPCVPRVGEFLKLANREVGDYFAWEVTDVTYREGGSVEIATELLENIQDRGFSFETEEELDEYLNSYIAEGWRCDRPVSENKRVKNQMSGGTSDA